MKKKKMNINESLSLLLSCGDNCESVLSELENAGIRANPKESTPIGELTARMTFREFGLLQYIPGIVSIECEQMKKAS